MEEKKKKGLKGRGYLRDFHLNSEGNYIYEGLMWKYDGDEISFKKNTNKLFVLTVLTFLVSMSSGLMPIPGTMNTWYVILPYVLELISSMFMGYKEYRLFKDGSTARDYEVKKSYDLFKPNLYFIFAGSIISIITELIFTFTNTFENGYLIIIFIISRIICILLTYLSLKDVKNIKYKVINN